MAPPAANPVLAIGPLDGLRVVITREASRAAGLAAALRAWGAEVEIVPVVRTEALDRSPLERALEHLAEHPWVLFTSRTAVRFTLDALARRGLDASALSPSAIGAVGPDTAAALHESGVATVIVPERHSATGLLEVLSERLGREARVLVVCAEGARDELREGLARLGAAVTEVHPYRTVPDERGIARLRDLLTADRVAVAVVTAPSALWALVRTLEALPSERVPKVATIGPTTTEAARQAGLEVVAEAEVATPEALARALAAWATARSRSGE